MRRVSGRFLLCSPGTLLLFSGWLLWFSLRDEKCFSVVQPFLSIFVHSGNNCNVELWFYTFSHQKFRWLSDLNYNILVDLSTGIGLIWNIGILFVFLKNCCRFLKKNISNVQLRFSFYCDRYFGSITRLISITLFKTVLSSNFKFLPLLV